MELKKISSILDKRIENNKNIHSEIHYLVERVRKDFNETAKKGIGSFGFYLGFFNRVGKDAVYKILSEMKHSGTTGQKKLFWWLIKKELEERKAKLTSKS